MEIMNLTDSSEMRNPSDLISNYKPPIIEIIEVSVEKGFAGSGTTEDFGGDTW